MRSTDNIIEGDSGLIESWDGVEVRGDGGSAG